MRRLLALLTLTLLISSSLAQQGMGPGPGLGRGGGGGASDFATDTFTEGSDTALGSHTPDLGGPITLHGSYTGEVLIDAASDRIFLNSAAAAAYYYDGTPPSADYYVENSVHVVSLISVNGGPCGHMATGADTMVCVRANIGNGAWELREISAGSGSTLASSTTNFPSTGQSRALRIIFASGGTTASVNVDGAEVIAATSITVTSAGKAGLRFAGQSTSSTGLHLDNFSAR